MKELGPFTEGEIPEPLTVTYTDAEGGALNLTGYDARWVFERERDGALERMADVVAPAADGQARYTWVDGDLGEHGKYRAEMWVGNGTNRFASEPFEFTVRRALAVPDI